MQRPKSMPRSAPQVEVQSAGSGSRAQSTEARVAAQSAGLRPPAAAEQPNRQGGPELMAAALPAAAAPKQAATVEAQQAANLQSSRAPCPFLEHLEPAPKGPMSGRASASHRPHPPPTPPPCRPGDTRQSAAESEPCPQQHLLEPRHRRQQPPCLEAHSSQ